MMPIPTEMRLQAYVHRQISEDRIGMPFSGPFVKYMLLVKVCSLSYESAGPDLTMNSGSVLLWTKGTGKPTASKV